MTVQQLIKQLSKMPQDAQVIYYDGDNGATRVESVAPEDCVIINPYSRESQTEPTNVVVLYDF